VAAGASGGRWQRSPIPDLPDEPAARSPTRTIVRTAAGKKPRSLKIWAFA